MILKPKSYIFAPMEGLTDQAYREIILETTTGWDYLFTPFFRFPTAGRLKRQAIVNHIDENNVNKYIIQVLTNLKGAKADHFKLINDLGISWLDINMGCPSKKVNAHGGGASLLDNPSEVEKIIKMSRNHYKGFLSVKIRSGVMDTSGFFDILKILEGEGVDAIIVHPRTRVEKYQGHSDWSLIRDASKYVKIPVIGNGDIISPKDIDDIYEQTECHSVMIGRGAIVNPWIPELHKQGVSVDSEVDQYRKDRLNAFMTKLVSIGELPRLKQLTNYLYKNDDLRKKLLRSESVEQFNSLICSEDG